MIDNVIAKSKPTVVQGVSEEDEAREHREKLMDMLKKFDLSSGWDAHVRARYEMDHWFAKPSDVPRYPKHAI